MKRRKRYTIWWSQDYWIALRFAWSKDGEQRERYAWVFKGPWFAKRVRWKLNARA